MGSYLPLPLENWSDDKREQVFVKIKEIYYCHCWWLSLCLLMVEVYLQIIHTTLNFFILSFRKHYLKPETKFKFHSLKSEVKVLYKWNIPTYILLQIWIHSFNCRGLQEKDRFQTSSWDIFPGGWEVKTRSTVSLSMGCDFANTTNFFQEYI